MDLKGGIKMPIGKQEMYFATGVDDLGKANNPIDPEFQTGMVFEFGGGLYLAEKKHTARLYAKRAYNSKIIKECRELNKKGNKVKLSNLDAEVYLYTFEVDFNSLDEYSHLVIREDNVREEHTFNVLKEYIESINYRPNITWTYGQICGFSWDENVNPTTISNLNDEDIKGILSRSMNDNQLCIHKRLCSSEEGNMKYLNCFKKVSMEILTNKEILDIKDVSKCAENRSIRKEFIKQVRENTEDNRRASSGND